MAMAAGRATSPGNHSGTILEARDLSMRFTPKGETPVTALAGLSVTARRGRVTAFVGPDGAGKTTLLRIAAGLMVPTGGCMTVLGLDVVDRADALRGRIGYMPQQFGLYEDLNVRENLDLYADLQSVPRDERPSRYERLLAMTGLTDFTARRAGRLSGGMKQKLGLACSLIKTPAVLILDEPTAGVDPISRRDLWTIVYRLVREDDIGVVLSTAYLDEAEACDHVVMLYQGRKLDEGPPTHFHERVRGRVALIKPGDGREPREVQAALAARPEVIDATIRAGRVRVVLRAPAGDSALSPDDVGGTVAPADPLFEDAFIDHLAAAGESHGAKRVAASGSPTAAAKAGTVVEVAGLTKRFGDFTAVRDIGFEVRRGEVFGLLGANGAGKTTTFRMLCGLLPASGGEIRVAGHDLRRAAARARARLGYMAQKFSLYLPLSVQHNLSFYGQAYGLTGRRLRERLEWALDEFDLRERRQQPAAGLPGGYRQRLAMAAAMLHEPDILFLDEPTSGADPLARREFWLRINGFARQGVTVIVTTHFMEEAEFCDRMLIMAAGTELAQGPPQAIRALARTPDNPEPSMEDAFIALAEDHAKPPKAEPGNG